MYTANSRPTIKKTKNRGIIDMLRKESVEQAASAGNYQEQKSERTLHLGIGTTKENSAVRHWMEQHITRSKHRETHREETEQNQLQYQTPASGSLPALILCGGNERPYPLSPGERYSSKVGQMLYGTHTHLRRTKKYTHYCLKQKDISTQGNKSNTGCEASVALDKEVFQAEDPCLCGQVGVKRLYA